MCTDSFHLIQVPFSGASTYFLDCKRYFRAIRPRQKSSRFPREIALWHMRQRASEKVFSHFVSSVVLTTVIATGLATFGKC